MASKGKGGLALIFGGPDKAPKDEGEPVDTMDKDADMPDDSAHAETSAEFDAAYDEWEQASDPEEKKSAFWRAVKACTEGV